MTLTNLTVNAGPMDANWQDRLREELIAVVSLVESNTENDTNWFNIEPTDDDGIHWSGTCWCIHEMKRYTFKVQFEIPATYPSAPIEIELPELDGLTAKMYRGGKICLDLHFAPLWRTNVPKFGIAHALCFALGPWLATEIPYLVSTGVIMYTHRIGLIADVQYADVDDVWNHMKTHKRRYRTTLVALKNAVKWWNENQVVFVADLGDAVDGCKNLDNEMAIHALNSIQYEWNKLNTNVIHLVGNHELYLFSRNQLVDGVSCLQKEAQSTFTCVCPVSLAGSPRKSTFYSFLLPQPSLWRVVVLDSYDVSTLTDGAGTLHAEALNLCQKNNPNSLTGSSNYFEGLQGPECRWCPFNGGLGEEQLQWLESVLINATKLKETLIVFSHVILHPNATPNSNCHTLLWNYDKVLKLFKDHSCVKIVICGHAHQPGYFWDPNSKIHHITLASPLEADDLAEETFGLIELSEKSAKLIGRGGVASMNLDLQ